MNVWEVIEANLSLPGNYIGLYGPPGTGKTYAAARYGIPEDATVLMLSDHDADDPEVPENSVALFSLTMTDGSSEAELRGHYIPREVGASWIDGPGSLAWKYSHHVTLSRLIINEIDRASDETLSFLYALADDPGSPGTMITLPNDKREVIRPGKNFSIVATMNGEPEDLPEALQDRFSWIPVLEVNPKAIECLSLDLRAPAAAAAVASSDRRISIRKWLAFDRLRAQMDKEWAAFTAFGPNYQDVLDSITVSKAKTRKTSYPEPEGHCMNPYFNDRFSAIEAVQASCSDWFCGYCECHSDDCDHDTQCKTMKFTNDEEFQDFVDFFGLGSSDFSDIWVQNLVARSWSKAMDTDTARELYDMQFA